MLGGIIKMKPVIVLNSGGFDSVALIHFVKYVLKEEEIISLHFNYGQRSEAKEQSLAHNSAIKVGAKDIDVTIPKFDWSSCGMLKTTSKDTQEYLEMRNVIFLSYALSIAESCGAKDIYMALINDVSPVHHIDTTPKFISSFNKFTKCLGTYTLHTPFIDLYKEDIAFALNNVGIKLHKDETFSCNFAKEVHGEIKECGVCPSCNLNNLIYETIFNRKAPDYEPSKYYKKFWKKYIKKSCIF
jgi:7-cyano-7-deazaguanine synthase